jgi:hypothetical protein
MTPKNHFIALGYALTAIAALTFLASLPNSEFVLRLARLTLDFSVVIAWPVAAVIGLYVLREPLLKLAQQARAQDKKDTTSTTSAGNEKT